MKHPYRFLLLVSLLSIIMKSSFAQWIKTNGPDGGLVKCFAVNGTDLFAGINSGAVFLSTDAGMNWTVVDSGLTGKGLGTLAVSGKNLFAGTYGDGVFLTTNNGTNWTAVNTGLPSNTWVWSLAISGTNLFGGTYGNGVILSTNNGKSWTVVDSGMTMTGPYAITGTWVYAIAFSGNYIFAATGWGTYRSKNGGSSWIATDSGLLNINYQTINIISVFAVFGTNIIGGSSSSVFLSTNNGINWILRNGPGYDINTFAVYGTSLFAGTTNGVYLSSDTSSSWMKVDNGLTDTGVMSLAVSGSYLFAGTDSEGVWRRPLSEMIMQVKDGVRDAPIIFALGQNYPNPFNPSTSIAFSIPSESFVTLKIFDIMGREVATLVNGELSAGNHTQQWNAVNMSSGVYFYRLSAVPTARRDLVPTNGRDGQAGTFTETKKLVLLR